MSSILNSPALALATAMAISGTAIFLALYGEKNFISNRFFVGNQNTYPVKHSLRSCLSSGDKKRNKKKKKVRFVDENCILGEFEGVEPVSAEVA